MRLFGELLRGRLVDGPFRLLYHYCYCYFYYYYFYHDYYYHRLR